MHGMKWLRDALFAPTTLSTSVSCLFLLLLALGCAPPTLILVNAQGVGFISVDCGASQNTTSGDISWTPDGNYTLLGSNAIARQNASPPYDTLRYFPNTRFNKSCYVFNTMANMPYLIRAGFFYGNYDNLSQLPSFVLLFEANVWANVKFKNDNETISHEMIALATSNTASVCVGRSSTTNHTPFISSLEIRPLSTNQIMYSPAHGSFLMKTNSRINFGVNINDTVRYPDDEFDRIWVPDTSTIVNISMYNTTLTTNMTVSGAASNDRPPSKVMQTARSPFNKTGDMGFRFQAKFGPGRYYIAFYFAELNSSTTHRIMDLYMDGYLIEEALNVSSLRGSYKTLELYNESYPVTGETYSLALMPNNSSTSAPIINAAESYFLQGTDQSTFEQDVQALEIIKSAFNLLAWMGDPCLPSDYNWAWLDCNNSGSQPRVIALKMSSMDLRGEIPSAVANLSALTSVDFHNNSLSGNVPSSLANLANLTFLDLSNNNLSGEYPTNIRVKANTTGNSFLCFNGSSCDAAPAPGLAPTVGVTPTRSGSRRLTRVIVGVLLPVIIVVVGAVLAFILYKRKSQNRKQLLGVQSAHWPPVPPFTEISKAVDPGVVQKGGSHDVPIFSFDDVKVITNNFENKINAAGGFGTLFYGTLSDGQEVVVKLLQSNIKQTPIEFLYKVTPLTYVNHKNLLRPIGFCAEIHRLMFVYEHVQKGSLYDYLHNKHMLDWKTRLSILQQVAQGLEHLHYACTPSIIHGNLKSTNVLLSGDGLLAKVTDFGIYELSPNVDATSGYLDPEYFSMQKLTDKSDVYSFGVLILEVVCGRMPFDTSLTKDAWNIVDWVHNVYDEGDHELIADACLHGNYNMSTLSKVVQLALNATKGNINERPTMAELVVELKEANKMEIGHHVVFAERDTSDLSDSSEGPLPPAYDESVCEDDAPTYVKS